MYAMIWMTCSMNGAMQFLHGKQGMLKKIFTTNRRNDVPSWDLRAFVSIKWFNVVTLPSRSKQSVKKLDDIAKEKAMYGFELYRATDHELQRLTSTSLVDESSVCGRDDEKKIVVSKLLAGSGQEARDMEEKIWVCVSEPFDGVRIAKAILEHLKVSTSNLVELQSLLQSVSQSINGKRVLLVLDDVWTEDHRLWEQLKPSLVGCARGSRILVTTRKGAVAMMMGTDHRIDIETLSDDACRDMEVVGEQYFQVLTARSFFQDIEKYGVEDFPFKMHDIVHDFAQYMTENECLTVDDNNLGEATVETSIERVRHLSMMLSRQTSFPSSIYRAKGLRSLLIANSGHPWLGVALPDVIKQLTCIRSLNLSGSSIEEIPKEVRRLDDEFVGIEEVENAKINEGEIARVTAFPKLKTLRIASLSKLEEWDGIERRVGEENATTTSIFIMPQLRELFILGCPLLRALPYYVLAAPLQELSVQYCPNLRKRYGKEEKGEDWHMISHIPKVIFI
ncbi:hypothetical protein OIU78_016516 [Salix suchowensis]|nr:hypothetical protein OIU78_016516 [Salix suchowensis]